MKSQENKNCDFSCNTNHARFNHFYNVDALLREEKLNLEKNKTNKNSEKFGEELNTIQSLWEDLGVTETYQLIFESIIKDLCDSMKKDLLYYELSSLKKFSDSLLVILIIIYLIRNLQKKFKIGKKQSTLFSLQMKQF